MQVTHLSTLHELMSNPMQSKLNFPEQSSVSWERCCSVLFELLCFFTVLFQFLWTFWESHESAALYCWLSTPAQTRWTVSLKPTWSGLRRYREPPTIGIKKKMVLSMRTSPRIYMDLWDCQWCAPNNIAGDGSCSLAEEARGDLDLRRGQGTCASTVTLPRERHGQWLCLKVCPGKKTHWPMVVLAMHI